MELSFVDYIRHIMASFKEETIRGTVENIRPSGSFVMLSGGRWKAVKYSGYTLITPSDGKDFENAVTYMKLLTIKKSLSRHLDLSKCVEAPEQALHMTVARLISGKTYEARRAADYEGRLLKRFSELFPLCRTESRPEFEIKGISIFPNGIVAAMVSPLLEGDYANLQKFRDAVYGDDVLAGLGVERKRKFIGHVTLFYIEKELSGTDRQKLTKGILEINGRFFGEPLSFAIQRAEVRRFDNFLSFDRREDWPYFNFDCMQQAVSGRI